MFVYLLQFTVSWGPSLCNIYQILLCTIQGEGAFSGSFNITIRNTKTGISMWLFTELIVILSSNSFVYWWTRCVYWEYLVVPGSVHEQKKNKKKLSSEPSLHATFVQISFAIPVLVSHSYPLSCFLICSCPSCIMISLIFLACEVLPGNDSSLQHRQHLSHEDHLVVIAPTQLSAARLVW